jgi:hypothetical protein
VAVAMGKLSARRQTPEARQAKARTAAAARWAAYRARQRVLRGVSGPRSE